MTKRAFKSCHSLQIAKSQNIADFNNDLHRYTCIHFLAQFDAGAGNILSFGDL